MAITPFGTATGVADNGTAGGTSQAVTPPASMVEGDLVILSGQYRVSAGTMDILDAGGQSWTPLALIGNTNVTAKLFWCRFNGTWSANPSVTNTTGTNALTAVMHVFRPTSGSNLWDVDVAQTELDYSPPGTPFTVTITGRDTTEVSTVTFAAWYSVDDNSWTSIAGTDWNVSGDAQYRNLQGNDQSCTFAYNIRTTAGTVANVSKNQSVVTGDGGTTAIVTFFEFADTPAPPAVVSSETDLFFFGSPF